MEPQHKELLRSNMNRLLECIDYNVISPFLVERKLFTKAMVDDIEKEDNRLLHLLKTLPTRGPRAFVSFVNLLMDTRQCDAVNILKDASELDATCLNNNYTDLPGEGRIEELPSVCATAIKATVLMEGPNIYKMSSKPRGLCLIINNINFGLRDGGPRKGAERDAIRADITFKDLGFLVYLAHDLSAHGMLEECKKFARREQHGECDAAIVLIMSHGNKDVVSGVDGSRLEIQAIVDLFNNCNCPLLRGKPKMFFIQACRGRKDDYGVSTTTTDSTLELPIPRRPPLNPADLRTFEDILIVQACAPGLTAIRDEINGSWFISILVEVLLNNAYKDHLVDMIDEVDRKIKTMMTLDGKRQTTTSLNVGFNKRLYFNPGLQA